MELDNSDDDDHMSFDSLDKEVRPQGKQPQKSKSGKLDRILQRSQDTGDDFYHEKGAEVNNYIKM